MKKYKHKITGNIAVETSSEKNYKVSEPRNFTVPKWMVENSCDWEEVKEKEYEILIMKNNHENLYSVDKDENLDYEFKLGHTIYSIKRLSDGEIFTIGDVVRIKKLNNDGRFKISEFYFDCNNEHLLCNGKKCGNGHVNITKIEHVRKLFTTEDGIDIYKGDRVWIILKDIPTEILRKAVIVKDLKSVNPYSYVFSSKEAAEEYIAKEKGKQLLEEAKKRYPKGTKFISTWSGSYNSSGEFYYKDNSIYMKSGGQVYYKGKWAEVVKEKTLEDYENVLLDMKGRVELYTPIGKSQFYYWMKLNEPKLYWTKVLQLIADDLNEGWKPTFCGNFTYYNIKPKYTIGYGLNYHCGNNEGVVYFKDSTVGEKAIQIMGDKLDHIFK